MQKLIIFILFFFLTISEKLHSELDQKFIDIFTNFEECTDEFVDYSNDVSSILENFEINNIFEAELISRIFNSYCFFSSTSLDSLNKISDDIFSDKVTNAGLIYAIHSSRFYFHLTGEKPDDIYTFISKELVLISKINTDDLGSSYNIENIIHNVAFAITAFENSQFDNFELGEIREFNYSSNLLYSVIEKFIFDIVDRTFTVESIERVATLLYEIRLAKASNLNLYGSPLEKIGSREELIKIYLNNYSNGLIEYYELNNLINSKDGKNLNTYVVGIEPNIDQIYVMSSISTTFKISDKFYKKGFDSESDEIFFNSIEKMLYSTFDQNPTTAIEIIFENIGYWSNSNCDLAKISYIPSDMSYESLIADMMFLSYKSHCNKDPELLLQALIKLNTFFDLLTNAEIAKDDFDYYFVDAQHIKMYADSRYLSNYPKASRDSFDLDKYVSIMISLNNKILNLGEFEPIKNADDIFDFLSVYFGIGIVKDLIYEHELKYKFKSQKLDDDYKKLESKLFQKLVFDEAFKKNMLIKSSDNSSKVNLASFLMQLGLAISNSLSTFTGDYLDVFMNEISISEKKGLIATLNRCLEEVTFYLDNINEIFVPTTPEFIFKTESLEKWFAFKNLMSMEIFLKYSLMMVDMYSFESYLELSKVRSDQIIALRPDNISLNKFKASYLNENKNLPYIDTVKKYIELQNKYRNLLESKILLSNEVYDSSANDSSALENEYRYELDEIQEQLFALMNQYEDYSMFSHTSISSASIFDFLDDDESLISYISGSFFSVGVLYTEGRIFLGPIPLSRSTYQSKSNKIFESFRSPNNEIPYEELGSLYDSFFPKLPWFDISKLKNVYIVTDEIYSGFPFHALYDENLSKWTIDLMNISYLPGEKFLIYSEKNKINKNDKFYGFGNPSLNKNTLSVQLDEFFNERGEFNLDEIKDLYELPETEIEILNIGKYFKNSKVFFQNEANENNVFLIDPEIDILAFATHSVKGMNKFYNDRGLVLTPVNSSDFAQDGFLSSKEIKDLKLSNKPVVLLTACNTIEEQFYLSLPYSGLAESFMEAGSSAILLSLWNVDSKSSSLINQGIFTQDDISFKDSIRDSILSLKSSNEFSHPYYWAPYIYLGK